MNEDYSGNIRLRIPPDLHARLAEIADRLGMSLNTVMVMILSEGAAHRSHLRANAPRDVAEALAEAVLDSVRVPTRKGQLIQRLDSERPEWRMWIPSRRLARQ